MANKNQKRIRAAIRLAHKNNESQLAIEVPTGGYHNNDKGEFRIRRVPIGGKPVYKKKVKPFPKVNDGPTLAEQRITFYGI